MTSRVLPPAEWPRLAGTELETLVPYLNPETTTVFVVQDVDGAIVGCWSLVPFLHAEGLWIRPEHRKSAGVFRRLLATMRKTLAERHEGAVWTSSMSDEVAAIVAASGGVPIPGTHYVIPVT
jgi:hypothetical protein